MNLLPFKKLTDKKDNNQQLVDNLRETRTKLKQLKIQEGKIKEEMELSLVDLFLYDINDNPIARLGITLSEGLDGKSIKEAEPEICAQHTKETTRHTWYLL